jgi:autophagy-related protein 18
MICELLFPSSILAVKLNRKSLVIVLEMEIYVYDISNMRLLHVIETTPNPEGTSKKKKKVLRYHPLTRIFYNLAICALSPSADSSYLAYPSPVPSPMSLATAANGTPAPPNPTATTAVASSSTSSQHQSGDVLLFSTRTLTVANVIQAHKSPLSFLSINSTGSLLATSSDKGTVIRVWSIPGAEKLYQFRRGTREAKIYSMNFNLVSTLLAVSSVHDTVHIFKLGASKNSGEKSSGNSLSPDMSESPDGGASPPASLEGGYDSFIEKKKSNSISYVFFYSSFFPVLTM